MPQKLRCSLKRPLEGLHICEFGMVTPKKGHTVQQGLLILLKRETANLSSAKDDNRRRMKEKARELEIWGPKWVSS